MRDGAEPEGICRYCTTSCCASCQQYLLPPAVLHSSCKLCWQATRRLPVWCRAITAAGLPVAAGGASAASRPQPLLLPPGIAKGAYAANRCCSLWPPLVALPVQGGRRLGVHAASNAAHTLFPRQVLLAGLDIATPVLQTDFCMAPPLLLRPNSPGNFDFIFRYLTAPATHGGVTRPGATFTHSPHSQRGHGASMASASLNRWRLDCLPGHEESAVMLGSLAAATSLAQLWRHQTGAACLHPARWFMLHAQLGAARHELGVCRRQKWGSHGSLGDGGPSGSRTSGEDAPFICLVLSALPGAVADEAAQAAVAATCKCSILHVRSRRIGGLFSHAQSPASSRCTCARTEWLAWRLVSLAGRFPCCALMDRC